MKTLNEIALSQYGVKETGLFWYFRKYGLTNFISKIWSKYVLSLY